MISNNIAELIDVRKATYYNVSDARDDGPDNGHDEVAASGASFVLVNFAVAQSEGVTVRNIDHIGAMMACWMRNGSIEPENILVAKRWDLSDAYKQVPLSDDAFNLDSYLAVTRARSQPRYLSRVSCLSGRCFSQSLTCHMEDRRIPASTLVVGILR